MMPLIALLLACGSPSDSGSGSKAPATPDDTEVPTGHLGLRIIEPVDLPVSVDSVTVRCGGVNADVVLETLGQATSAELDLIGPSGVVTVPLQLTSSGDGAVWHHFEGTVGCTEAEGTTWVARAFRNGSAVDCAVHGVDGAGALAGSLDGELAAVGRPAVGSDCHDIHVGR